MKELLEALASHGMGEPDVEIVSFSWEAAASASLRVVIRDNVQGAWRWIIACDAPADFRMLPGYGPLRMQGESHPAARQFLDPRVDLYFSMVGTDYLGAAEALEVAHQRVGGACIPIDRYVNAPVRIPTLLRAKAGKLAYGPEFLVDAYASALADFEVSCTRFRQEASIFDLPLVPGQDRWTVLEVASSFIVARGFEARPDPAG